jgi:hypothetical protein
MLKNRMKNAKTGVLATKKEFEEYHSNAGEEKQKLYSELEKKAMTERGDAMTVYDILSEG